jgi:hypothetical protein
MDVKRGILKLVCVALSCGLLVSCPSTLFANEATPLAKGKVLKHDRGHRGHRGGRGHHGHRGHRGHRGREGLPGVQGVQGPQGSPGLQGIPGVGGEAGLAGVLTICSSWGYDPKSFDNEDAFLLYACNIQSSDEHIQFLQPAPLFKGYVPPDCPITFTKFKPGNYPIDLDTTVEGKFTIQPGGEGQYLIQYGLVGVPNGRYNQNGGEGPLENSLLIYDFMRKHSQASCWICVKITPFHGEPQILGAIPLSVTRTRNAQKFSSQYPANEVAPLIHSFFILAGFGQITQELHAGDQVTLMVMLGSLNQPEDNVPLQNANHEFIPTDSANRILFINQDNIMYRHGFGAEPLPANAMPLAGGPTLSLIRMSTMEH